jgi:uncharacterized protein with HEPN domain
MERGDLEWIGDVLAAINDIRADTAGMGFAAFSQNPVVIRSVLYSISVIGEAVKQISAEFKSARPEISWRAIAAMRDRIIHEYFGLIRGASGMWWRMISIRLSAVCSRVFITLRRWRACSQPESKMARDGSRAIL